MSVFDKFDPSIDLLRRHWQLNAETGLVLPGVSLFDEFGNPFNRTNPIAVEQLPKANFFTGFLVDSTGSSQMAGDFRFTGTPIEVHNGTDNAYWTGVQVAGTPVTFDDTSQAFDGTQSILINNLQVGSVFELDSGTTVDLSGHVALELRVWVVGNYTNTDFITVEGWDGATVGTPVNLSNYIQEDSVGMWQSAVLPTVDMGLSSATITGLRIRQGLKNGQAPTLNLDAIKWQESGGARAFSATAPPGTRVRIECIFVTMTDEFTPLPTNNSSHGIPPLAFMSVPSLENGIATTQFINGTGFAQGIAHNFRDSVKFAFDMDPPITDGTTTTVRLTRSFNPPLTIEGPAALNSVTFSFSDDTTGWLSTETFWSGSIELI